MVALIDISNGRNNLAYVGETPWHGLGQKLTPGTGIDQWRVEAGMDWEAKKATVMFRDDDGVDHMGEDRILYRSDTKAPLGVCSDRYKIVQPTEVIEFYRDLVGTQGWDIEVAGCLDGGKRLWALAKTDGEFAINNTIDRIGTYLLLATSFDGTMATVGKFTSVRVVCQNTLSMSLKSGEAQISVPHSRQFDAVAMKEELGIYAEATNKMHDEMNEMAKYKLNDSEAIRFIMDVLAGTKVKPEDLSTRAGNIITNVFDLYRGKGKGSTLPTADGTLYGVVNALTEYHDHHVNSRTTNNRLKSAWFGKGDENKTNAYNLALAKVA